MASIGVEEKMTDTRMEETRNLMYNHLTTIIKLGKPWKRLYYQILRLKPFGSYSVKYKMIAEGGLDITVSSMAGQFVFRLDANKEIQHV